MNLKAKALILVTTIIISAPAAMAADGDVANLTHLFAGRGLAIERLQVFEVGGVVIIRGRTADRVHAEEAGRVAQQLGYGRVANLVQINEPVNDAEIVRLAERELGQSRSLDGCRFHLAARNGVVRIGGHVHHELQEDLAVRLVRSIRGVRGVQSDIGGR